MNFLIHSCPRDPCTLLVTVVACWGYSWLARKRQPLSILCSFSWEARVRISVRLQLCSATGRSPSSFRSVNRSSPSPRCGPHVRRLRFIWPLQNHFLTSRISHVHILLSARCPEKQKRLCVIILCQVRRRGHREGGQARPHRALSGRGAGIHKERGNRQQIGDEVYWCLP